jgi:LPXTG-site transpeptidase (sortase) family protein
MPRNEFIKLLIFRTAGNFLVLFTIFGFLATFGPAAYYEFLYRVGQFRGVHYSVIKEEGVSELGKLLARYGKNPDSAGGSNYLSSILIGEKEKVLVPPSADFSVVIPKIGAAEGITANVDPSNEKEYLQVLTNSIAHAKGTSFPGLGGSTYLFAHSADNFWNVGRYNAVFYLLKELTPGDDIYVFFQGKRHNYKVYETKIVDRLDTQYIDSVSDVGERVILQTCWPPGTDWQRILIFAKPGSV